jgi:hypothetical protein
MKRLTYCSSGDLSLPLPRGVPVSSAGNVCDDKTGCTLGTLPI